MACKARFPLAMYARIRMSKRSHILRATDLWRGGIISQPIYLCSYTVWWRSVPLQDIAPILVHPNLWVTKKDQREDGLVWAAGRAPAFWVALK
jgi:hypothetical protein